jgi:hypothetical protein
VGWRGDGMTEANDGEARKISPVATYGHNC